VRWFRDGRRTTSSTTDDGAEGRVWVGAACRNRTDDLFITSESLYRLS
jgi:hypothetical protein